MGGRPGVFVMAESYPGPGGVNVASSMRHRFRRTVERLPSVAVILDDAVRLAGRTVARIVTRPAPYDLRGRVVFITGAARGLGAETARRAHARGARVALVGRRLAPLQQLADDLGSDAAAFEADVTSAERLQRAADDA